MDSASSSSSVSAPREASHRDEIFMQQGLLFSNSLKDLKNLRKQLYSAAEYFEVSYSKEDQKDIVVEALRDYVTKAFINTVDHLGSVAYKFNSFLDEKSSEVSQADFKLSCIEQRLRTCKELVDGGALFQQSLVLKFPKHHKRYTFSDGSILDDFISRPMQHYRSYCSESKFRHVINVKYDRETRESPSPLLRRGLSPLLSPQSFYRPRTFQLTNTSSKSIRTPEIRADSPKRSPFIRSGSLFIRSLSPSSSNAKQRYPSVPPRRLTSMPIRAERDQKKEFEQYTNKSNRVFKALLSMGKFRSNKVYKNLDTN